MSNLFNSWLWTSTEVKNIHTFFFCPQVTVNMPPSDRSMSYGPLDVPRLPHSIVFIFSIILFFIITAYPVIKFLKPYLHISICICHKYLIYSKITIHTRTRTHTYIHTHARTHTYIHTHAHTYIHTHAYKCFPNDLKQPQVFDHQPQPHFADVSKQAKVHFLSF